MDEGREQGRKKKKNGVEAKGGNAVRVARAKVPGVKGRGPNFGGRSFQRLELQLVGERDGGSKKRKGGRLGGGGGKVAYESKDGPSGTLTLAWRLRRRKRSSDGG